MSNWKANHIITVCADHFGFTADDLRGKHRGRTVCFARHVAMMLVRDRLGLSYPETGMAFGDRDHTTVMHGVARARRCREMSPGWNDTITAIEAKLAGT